MHIHIHINVCTIYLCTQVYMPPLLCAQSLYVPIFVYHCTVCIRMSVFIALYENAYVNKCKCVCVFAYYVCHLTVCDKYLLNFAKLSKMELIKKSITKLNIPSVVHPSCCISMALRSNCHGTFRFVFVAKLPIRLNRVYFNVFFLNKLL